MATRRRLACVRRFCGDALSFSWGARANRLVSAKNCLHRFRKLLTGNMLVHLSPKDGCIRTTLASRVHASLEPEAAERLLWELVCTP
jgi:hypothetical protein